MPSALFALARWTAPVVFLAALTGPLAAQGVTGAAIQGTVTMTGGAPLLRASGFDALNKRPVYALAFPRFDDPELNLSRWRLQLGARYSF